MKIYITGILTSFIFGAIFSYVIFQKQIYLKITEETNKSMPYNQTALSGGPIEHIDCNKNSETLDKRNQKISDNIYKTENKYSTTYITGTTENQKMLAADIVDTNSNPELDFTGNKKKQIKTLLNSSKESDYRHGLKLLSEQDIVSDDVEILESIIRMGYHETDPESISHMIQHLSNMIDEQHEHTNESIDILTHYLNHDNSGLRSDALMALTLSESTNKESLIPHLRRNILVGSDASRAKAIAAFGIANIDDSVAVESIRQMANSENESPEIRLSAIEALSHN